MSSLGLLALGLGGVWMVARARFDRATLTLLVGLTLVPTTLWLPIGPRWLALSRLLLWAYVAALFLRVRKGEISADALRPGRVHLALGAFVVAAFLLGVVLVPPPAATYQSALNWITLADQLLALVAIVAAARQLGPWWIARRVVVLAGAIAAIGISERLLDVNWNNFWYPPEAGFNASPELRERGGAIRVRGPSLFALELAWVTAGLVPLALVVASRARRTVWLLVPAGLALASVFTVSRSSVPGLALGLMAVMLLARDPRVTRIVLVAFAVAAVAFVSMAGLSTPYEGASEDSADSRLRRFAFVAGAVSDRPLLGLGLSGPRAQDVHGTDTSYVFLYATLGVVGITTFLFAVGTALLAVGRGLRGPPDEHRVLAAGALASMVTLLAGAAFYDAFTVPGSSRLFWLSTAVGLVAVERRLPAPRRAGPVDRAELARRLSLPLAGICLGLVLATLAPVRTVYSASFNVVDEDVAWQLSRPPNFRGRALITTTCDLLADLTVDGASVECREPRRAPTIGLLRIEGSEAESVVQAAAEVRSRIQRYTPETEVQPLALPTEGRATWATTAPVWLGLAGLAFGVLLPLARPLPPTDPRPDPRSDRALMV